MAITRVLVELYFSIFLSSTVESARILCRIYRKDEIYEKSGSGDVGGKRTIYASVSRDMELNIQSFRENARIS